MTREKDDADSSNSNSNGSSISSGRNSCFEAATDQRVLRKSLVGQRRGGRSASVTFSVKAAGDDVGNNDAISVWRMKNYQFLSKETSSAKDILNSSPEQKLLSSMFFVSGVFYLFVIDI